MSTHRLKVFVSSAQKEFARQRSELKAFLLGDAFLRRFIAEVFLFEELPAQDQRADQVYLGEVAAADIYLGIFGNEYGSQDADGLSPTEREFDHATRTGRTRFVYVWGQEDKSREPKMRGLIRKASAQLIRRRVEDVTTLKAEVYASLVDYLDRLNAFRVAPFDADAGRGASLGDLSRSRVEWFLERAHAERGFPLTAKTGTEALLAHLNLLPDRVPANAALLLFGTNPQRFHRSAETRCVHFHGTEVRKPLASQQIYTGDLFTQADQALDFVLARINRSVGTRFRGATAPARFELPKAAVAEAIINAIAHRDYSSNASVEVRLFADRLEVWNPGSLPGTLTVESLRTDHPSIPRNPLLAEPLYLARYIERAGTGTQDMLRLCREAGLPEPEFGQRAGSFVLTLWRDWLTNEVLGELELNDRQRAAVAHVKVHHRISNIEYQRLTGAIKKTATRDLDRLVQYRVFRKVGRTGRGTYYTLTRKGDIKGTMGTSSSRAKKET